MTRIVRRTEGQAGAPLVLTFHGTGGSEDQFHGLAEALLPGAHVTSPRGEVSEGGAARYFRRTGEGVYDMADLSRRTDEMAAFIAAEIRRSDASRVIALGYSNGANILASVAFQRPDLFHDLILMHPLIPWQPAPQPGLADRRVLITAGERDPICPAPATAALTEYFRAQSAETTLHQHSGGHEIRDDELEAIRSFLQPLVGVMPLAAH